MSSRRDDDPVPVRETLAAVGADLGLPDPDALATLQRRWPDLAAGDIAGHAGIGSLRDRVLTVVVDDAGWATKLRYRESEIVRWAERAVGSGVVREVRIRVARPG